MSLIPCSACRKRVPEKLSQVTWAWYRADGQRVAYRQRLCTSCYLSAVQPLDVEPNFDELTCPACGMSVEHDMDPCYATAFLPGMGRVQLEIASCASCAVTIRQRAQEGAERLEDRPRVEGPESSPSTLSTRESYWTGLGIVPREPRA
jgi:hypothetical protein